MDSRPKLLRILHGERVKTPPLWLMRQAGRYLPEYRKLRETAGDFWTLVETPSYAATVTLQPLERFPLDAAILFADILTIPKALGIPVTFVPGRGPQLLPLKTPNDVHHLGFNQKVLHPIANSLQAIRESLPAGKTLIGFSGAPWTLAAYMLEGQGSREFSIARRFAYDHPAAFEKLIDKLTAAVIDYCKLQIQAGAQVIQLFESWAGILPHEAKASVIYQPTKKIVTALQSFAPQVPIIGYPRGLGETGCIDYVAATNVTALGLDERCDLTWLNAHLPPQLPVQGAIDPLALLAGGNALEQEYERCYTALSPRPWICNLGHGIRKETPILHVQQLCDLNAA